MQEPEPKLSWDYWVYDPGEAGHDRIVTLERKPKAGELVPLNGHNYKVTTIRGRLTLLAQRH